MEREEETRRLAGGPGERDRNLDLIRALAGFLVVSVHFIMMTEFYYQPMTGAAMLLVSMLRMAFMNCVPLFLLLTGYLCCGKKLSGSYYWGVARVLAAYLLCSAVSLLFRWRYLGEEMSLLRAGRMILDYTGVATGWYMEMYLGLFLLIPFLNMLWQGAESRENRRTLIATLLFLTSLPLLTNLKYRILPGWWKGMYPLTYYFLGAWFRTYRTRVRLSRAIPGFLAAVAVGGGLMYLVSGGRPFQWTEATDWAGPTVVCSACLLFLMLRQVKLDGLPRWAAGAIRKGAELSLNIYLISWCFDNAFYPILWRKVPVFTDRMAWYPVMTLAVYLSSALAAQALEWLCAAFLRTLRTWTGRPGEI